MWGTRNLRIGLWGCTVARSIPLPAVLCCPHLKGCAGIQGMSQGSSSVQSAHPCPCVFRRSSREFPSRSLRLTSAPEVSLDVQMKEQGQGRFPDIQQRVSARHHTSSIPPVCLFMDRFIVRDGFLPSLFASLRLEEKKKKIEVSILEIAARKETQRKQWRHYVSHFRYCLNLCTCTQRLTKLRQRIQRYSQGFLPSYFKIPGCHFWISLTATYHDCTS